VFEEMGDSDLKRKSLLIFFLLIFNFYHIYCQQVNQTYAAEMTGRIDFKNNNRIEINIAGYQYNGEYNYRIEEKSGISFLEFGNHKELVLISEDFLYFAGRYLIGNFINRKGRNGKQADFIWPARKYASSSYLAEGKIDYKADNLDYVHFNRPWAEGVSGSGIHEYIDAVWSWDISALIIVNGFISSRKPELYAANNRVKKLRIYHDNTDAGYEFDLKDTPNPQILRLPFKSRIIRIEILDVYKGDKYDDTCLTMLQGIAADIDDVFFSGG
jgi:hypothetical protein